MSATRRLYADVSTPQLSGRWDPSYFPTQPVPQQLGEQAEPQKQATRAAVEARAQVRLQRKYDGLKKKRNKSLYPDQLALVAKLHDGCLEAEANRLTMISGPGRDSNEEMAQL